MGCFFYFLVDLIGPNLPSRTMARFLDTVTEVTIWTKVFDLKCVTVKWDSITFTQLISESYIYYVFVKAIE